MDFTQSLRARVYPEYKKDSYQACGTKWPWTGLRLGTFQILTNLGYTTSQDGEYSFPKNIAASAIAGGVATWVGSPFYLVGTRTFLIVSYNLVHYISTWFYIQDFVDMFCMHIGLQKNGKDISLWLSIKNLIDWRKFQFHAGHDHAVWKYIWAISFNASYILIPKPIRIISCPLKY